MPNANCCFSLPIHFHCELKLSGIVRRCRLSCVGPELVHRGHVEPIYQVEHVGDQIHAEAFIKVDTAGDAEIVEHRPGLYAGVACEVAIE